MAARESAGRRGGASLSRTALRDRLRGWLQHHRLSAADSLVKVLDSPWASLLTWLVIGIALALPVALGVALDNTERMSRGWDSPAQMSLFLDRELDAKSARLLRDELARRETVTAAGLQSRDDALAEFSALSGFADVVESLSENPLPDVVLLTPRADMSAAEVEQLQAEVAGLAGVDEVVLDMAWLQRLQGLLELTRRVVLALGAMLIVGVILILGNTIRLAIESRREEIVITKLVGGSNAFVRRPFLYTGLWFGVGGGLVAGLLVSGAVWYLSEPVEILAALYNSHFSIEGPGVMGVLNLVILGGLLGLAGAWLAVSRHLSAIEPS